MKHLCPHKYLRRGEDLVYLFLPSYKHYVKLEGSGLTEHRYFSFLSPKSHKINLRDCEMISGLQERSKNKFTQLNNLIFVFWTFL